MNGFTAGISLGFSLILAIGSQNSYVLKQGLKRENVFMVCFVCALSDAILITMGVFGFNAILSKFPYLEPIARYGGALFLFLYGLRSFQSSIKNTGSLAPAEGHTKTVVKSILVCLAFTWLNPHVYLDTVVLLGSISTQYEGSEIEFAAGAILASFIFFFSLGYGSRLLDPIFKKPTSWKVLDFVIGCVMWLISLNLIFR